MSLSLSDISITHDLQPGDIGFIIHLHGKIYLKECGFGLKFESYVAAGLHEFLQQYDPATSRAWICRHNGTIIGSLVLMNRGKEAQLRYFILEEQYRGIGLGKKLMTMFMEFYKQCGYQACYLLTTAELPAAAHLYRSWGFEVTSEHATAEPFGKQVIEQRYDLKVQK